ncbi:hypothetical protein QBC44DRAFT_390324 [Cladorrhinum sp. PSN332]|nr:hypothetical protein QBC44DRAFT_390324 [Cladorrhinum sp. PSN332]
MHLVSTLLGLLWATPLSASPVPQGSSQSGGTGPFSPASYTTIPALSSHTIYLPQSVPSGSRLPILLWGNGGCSANGLSFRPFLTQLASHGIFVISSGAPNGNGQTTAALMTRGIDWVHSQEAKTKYPFLEPGRIAVAGMSCGGVEAYSAGHNDSRVSTIGIFNSGLLSVQESERIAKGIKKPTFYFLGGESDIAYANGERDYKLLPAGTPSWKGNLDVGHGGTYSDKDGGKFGVAAVAYFDWLLRGNAKASSFFTDGTEAKNAGWKVESKNLGAIKVAPL